MSQTYKYKVSITTKFSTHDYILIGNGEESIDSMIESMTRNSTIRREGDEIPRCPYYNKIVKDLTDTLQLPDSIDLRAKGLKLIGHTPYSTHIIQQLNMETTCQKN